MQRDSSTAAYKEVSSSATWLSKLSPIPSPAPRHIDHAHVNSSLIDQSPLPLKTRGYSHDMRAVRRSQPWGMSRAAPPSTSLYPHLVRSRSPPSRSPAHNDFPAQRPSNGQTPLTDDSVGEVPPPSSDLFADVLKREWPFQPSLRDTEDFTAAVEFGRSSMLLHYANDGFQEVSARLATEAGAVSLEAARYRQAAQSSVAQCRSAAKVYAQTKEELADAKRKLSALLAAAAAKEERAQKSSTMGQSPEHVSANSADAQQSHAVNSLTLQLSEELDTMRTRKQRYELLRAQQTRLAGQVEEWSAKEKKLEARLEREETRYKDALGNAVARARASCERLSDASRTGGGSTLRDFDVCINERAGLLRHLQKGSEARLVQMRQLLERFSDSPAANSNGDIINTAEDVHHHSSTEQASGANGDTEAQKEPFVSAAVATTEIGAGDAQAKVLERLSAALRTVSLGEKEAVAEMEHIRLLLSRLQRGSSVHS